jgi:hypothetical protein
MVWVFKTSVKNKSQVNKIVPLLDNFILPPGKWNFDLTDCDKILRIESGELCTKTLIDELNKAGFLCEELT